MNSRYKAPPEIEAYIKEIEPKMVHLLDQVDRLLLDLAERIEKRESKEMGDAVIRALFRTANGSVVDPRESFGFRSNAVVQDGMDCTYIGVDEDFADAVRAAYFEAEVRTGFSELLDKTTKPGTENYGLDYVLDVIKSEVNGYVLDVIKNEVKKQDR